MTRALLAIGCNLYNDSAGFDALDGAEGDAQRLYERLIQSDIGGYDACRSRLLLSPTSIEAQQALVEMLSTPLDTFTIFFAGHGACEGGSVYLCLRDTVADQMWHHSLPLALVFGYIAGAQPAQSNIIIDACFGGGLVGDLSAIIKPEVLGAANTLSVTMLAMAAMDQTAGELPSGGIGTNALIGCIDGDTFVQDHGSALDLTEIGPIVAERVQWATAQQPVWWALNRQRRESFCRNPFYQASAESAFEQWNARAFLDTITPALASQSENVFELISTLERLTGNLIERSSEMSDAFLAVEVRATRIAALLDYVTPSGAVEAKLVEECVSLSNTVKLALEELGDSLAAENYALLSPGAALSDLFHLPIRITKLLGWMGAAWHIDQRLGSATAFPVQRVEQIADAILEHYTGAITAMSDIQAAYVVAGIPALETMGLGIQGEQMLSLLFSSLVTAKGAVADGALAADEILTYLVLRAAGELEERPRLLARPGELATALLKLATRFDLADVFDESMATLDHLPVGAFVTRDYAAFGKRYIEDGQNHTMQIGQDIWRVSELEAVWPPQADLAPTSSAVACAAITSSLLFPDRVAWFLAATRHSPS